MVIATVGGVRPGVLPVTIREIVPPLAVKLTVVAVVRGKVGVKRTVTVCDAPAPTRLNGLPATILNGAEADAQQNWMRLDVGAEIIKNRDCGFIGPVEIMQQQDGRTSLQTAHHFPREQIPEPARSGFIRRLQ